MTPMMAFFSGLGAGEFCFLVVLGILLYGKNLPTVARTLGRTIGEFRKHMKSVEEQIKKESWDDTDARGK